MKYKMHYMNKAGLVGSWTEVELPDDAIPLHTQIWKISASGDSCTSIKDSDEILGDKSNYKYNSETGELLIISEDGKNLLEYRIVTRIYCLIPLTDVDSSNSSAKITKMIDEIHRRKVKNMEIDNSINRL
jgi:hypothetical protein